MKLPAVIPAKAGIQPAIRESPALEEQRFVSAGQRLGQALRTFRAFEMRTELLGCLEDCATLAALRGRARDAAIIAAAAAASRKRLSLAQSHRAALRTQELASAVADHLGADQLTRVTVEGEPMAIDDAIKVALDTILPGDPARPPP